MSSGPTVSTQAQPTTLLLPSAYVPGTRIARYIILETLGQGGMGAVYSAYDADLHRRVALKFLLPRVADGTDVGEWEARLLLEARAMARLSHPNVVTLYDVGTAPGGGIYLAMELVDGGTIKDWLALGRKDSNGRDAPSPRGWREVITLLSQAGEGLAAAHAAGLIHRDFKLENVLVRSDGRPQVTDFGVVRTEAASVRGLAISTPPLPGSPLASPSDSPSQLTLTGSMLGTPGYMAPEQYATDKVIDARADIFSFSVALYRALYGQRPFVGDSVEQVAEATKLGKLQEPPAGSDVPGWVRKVVLWGLSPKREDRPDSMHVLLAALRADPVKRKQRWLAAGLVVVIGLGVLGGARAVQGRRGPRVLRCGRPNGRRLGCHAEG